MRSAGSDSSGHHASNPELTGIAVETQERKAARHRAVGSSKTSVSPAAANTVWRTAASDVPKKDRVVTLPEQSTGRKSSSQILHERIDEGNETQSDAEEVGRDHHSVRMFCVAERLDLAKLEVLLRARLGTAGMMNRYPKEAPEVLQSPPLLSRAVLQPQDRRYPGSIFYFGYGVVVFWCTSVAEEIEVLRDVVAQAEIEPVKAREVSWDQFGLNLSSREQPSIQNDIITISRRSSGVKTKLALSHALAQSTKLLMLEKEIQQLAERTRFIPEEITKTGKSTIMGKDLKKLTGNIFLKAHNLNVVNPIMETPEWLEEQTDDRLLQTYKKVRFYLGMHDRVTIVNNRLECLKDLLTLLHDQRHDADGIKLYKIVIALLMVSALLTIAKALEIVIPGAHKHVFPHS